MRKRLSYGCMRDLPLLFLHLTWSPCGRLTTPNSVSESPYEKEDRSGMGRPECVCIGTLYCH